MMKKYIYNDNYLDLIERTFFIDILSIQKSTK